MTSARLRNKVDPWANLNVATSRGIFTGNRGCLVDAEGNITRHHSGTLWIICQIEFRGLTHPLNAPRTWTPVFFLDDAVGLAAGHRPCGFCRRSDYLAYRAAIGASTNSKDAVLAPELTRRLAAERHGAGRGMDRRKDRLLWSASLQDLPQGSVIVDPRSSTPHLVTSQALQPFTFGGWGPAIPSASSDVVQVLTPPTSVDALRHGFVPTLHESASVQSEAR
jgi:hypothetical protein